MTLNGLGLLAVGLYAAWRMWNIKNRATISSSPAEGVALMFEIIYTIIMAFLLTAGSKIFILVALISFLLHASIGGYYEMFRPDIISYAEAHLPDGIMSYWYYLVIDTAVTLLCYVTLVNGGLV